ncbi:MAG: prephenate dehydrogenase/arogenate dehydrogenase family protein [Bacillota bacterium]|nr:prephenate dehydrogenase/arogenate dehydrogenase family protein [Bacillota bacterium]
MEQLTIGFIGLGLIGGSIARSIKRVDKSVRIMAYMRTRASLEAALHDGTIDRILDRADDPALSECDIIYLCTPVEYIASYLETIRPLLKDGAVISDVGSTKTEVHHTVSRLGMEACFVGGHPMAGSEKTGYEHSNDHLLENAYYVITPTASSPKALVDRIESIANMIGAIPIILDYQHHDEIVATISHLPHIIAASLVNLVRERDDKEQNMKNLAAGGFKDITRIASSSPIVWEQIAMTNTDNIVRVLEAYIASLNTTLDKLKSHTEGYIEKMFTESREYRSSFTNSKKGSLDPDYSFSVDVRDELGAIAVISSILATAGINIRNIGINNSRDYEDGTMQICFYDKDSMDAAIELLLSFNYKLSL